MATSERIDTIDPATFDELLLEYPNAVPSKLADLDKQRYDTIPASLQKQKGTPLLTKEQVATLVDWKLSHGKFRPTLKSLVQQNAAKDVEQTTKSGFDLFSNTQESAKASLNALTKLKGIGPATASLLLSVYSPDTAPFFSDELFRWCFFEDGKGKGWDREIKYNVKEYLQLFDKVQELKRRFQEEFQRDLRAVDIEKVAYVLGKRHGGISSQSGSKVASQTSKRKATRHDSNQEEPAKAAKLELPVKSGKAKLGQSADISKRPQRKTRTR